MASFLFASSLKGETGGEEEYLIIKKASPHTKYADFFKQPRHFFQFCDAILTVYFIREYKFYKRVFECIKSVQSGVVEFNYFLPCLILSILHTTKLHVLLHTTNHGSNSGEEYIT